MASFERLVAPFAKLIGWAKTATRSRKRRAKRSLLQCPIESLESRVVLSNARLTDVLAPDPDVPNDYFGTSVAISSDYYVVGAHTDPNDAIGAVYVFDVNTGELLWKLRDPTGQLNTQFGRSVAVSGNTLVVGAWGNGTAYAFDALTGELLFSMDDPETGFGWSVAISDDTIAVGAPFQYEVGGKVHVFDAVSGSHLWTLSAPDSDQFNEFGTSVSVSGHYVAVGAPKARNEVEATTGKAYVFDATDGSLDWYVGSMASSELSLYGGAVALSGETLVVGAPQQMNNQGFTGLVYVYDTVERSLMSILENPLSRIVNVNDFFGDSVSVSGNSVVVSRFGGHTESEDVDSIFVFSARSGELRQRISFDFSSGTINPKIPVGILGRKIITGGLKDDSAQDGLYHGRVGVYELYGDDLLVFDPATGRWRMGINGGADFTWVNGPKWNPAAGWRTFTGDYNGDGLTDGIGINNQNAVFFARNNGNGTMTTVSAGSFSGAETFQNVLVGDFNGDFKDDLIVQQESHNTTPLAGSWFVKSWNGTSIATSFYGRWEASGWVGFGAEDVNGDGADDIIGLINATGALDRVNWIYGISNIIPDGSRRFVSQFAGAFTGRVETTGWHSILIGDWNNDLRPDVAARRGDGRFVYGTSTGPATDNTVLSAKRLVNSTGPLFSPAYFSGLFYVGDFNGDGRDDILGRQDNNKNLWVASTNPTVSTAQLWTAWNGSTNWLGSAIGDFNNDGYSDYLSVDGFSAETWFSTTANLFSMQTFGLDPIVGPVHVDRASRIFV